jgi:hypothetical protein
MHHALVVRGAEAEQDLADDVHDPRGRHRRGLLDEPAQRLALEQLHHHEGATVRRVADVVDVGDVIVADARGVGGLAVEALDRFLVLGQLLQQDLDGDPLAQAEVATLVHRAHAAAPDHAQDLVPLRQHLAEEIVDGWLWPHPPGMVAEASWPGPFCARRDGAVWTGQRS